MHADPVGDPGTRQNEEDDRTNDPLRRAPLAERARLPARPHQERAEDEPQSEDPAHRGQEDVEDDDARCGVDQGDGEG